MLSVQNLSVTLGKTKVLDKINLIAEPGKVTALLGGSGAGKSTFLRAMVPAFRNEFSLSGEINWEGKPLTKKNQTFVQTVFQDPHGSFSPYFSMKLLLFEPLLIRGIIPFLKEYKLVRQKIEELVSAFGLDKSLLDRKSKELSGGQLQRFAIIRALVADPKLILLDEPVTALDLISQFEVIQIFLKWKEKSNLTFLLVSHDLDLVRKIADSVYVLDKGKIVESGKTKEVFEKPKSLFFQNLLKTRI